MPTSSPQAAPFGSANPRHSVARGRVGRRDRLALCTLAPMSGLFEIVPNFSEGRDAGVVESLVQAMSAQGATVLDWSMDPDHNRSVVTAVGGAEQVLAAALAAAAVAFSSIDLRTHSGVHPRVGALDVLPFVPLVGASRAEAVTLAVRAADGLADLGVPSFLYGWASPSGNRSLAKLRKGGFEALVSALPDDQKPDTVPENWPHPGVHPTAGICCVGARPVLLAWNVYVEGLEIDDLRGIARELRERDGGYPGLRALGFHLQSTDRMQISMNLEDLERTSPFVVFRSIEERVEHRGGSVVETEIIGMVPDDLLLHAAADRLKLSEGRLERLLSRRVAEVAGALLAVEE